VILLAIAAQSPTPSPPAAPGAGVFNSPFLMSLMIWLPVVAALAIAVLPNPRGRFDGLIKQIAFFTNVGLAGVLFIAYSQFETFLPTAQYEEKVSWLPALGVSYHFGVDGVGMLMLILSAMVGIASVLASLGIRERVRSYFCLLLLTQASVNGAIASRDMFVLILFWGAAVVPLMLLIQGWGGARRQPASWRLVGYWGLGTAALIAGTMTLYASTGGTSFDMDVLLKAALSSRIQFAVGLLMIVAGASRLPLFPFHGWFRDVCAEAPPGVAIVVAGASTRLGGYLILRTLIAAEPSAAYLLSPLLAALAALTVGYAGLAALRAADIRVMASYLALIPGGLTGLGLAALSPLGITGTVLSLFAGGMAAALVVGACATLAERAQSRSLHVLSGLGPRMPNMTWLLIVAVLGLLGAPVLATFQSNLMTFFGAFKVQPIGAFAVAAGMVMVAVSLAVLVHRVLFAAPNPEAPSVSDASLAETWYLAILATGLLWVGLFPGGPKIPGTDTPLFDPGLINVMSAGISDMAGPYTGPSAQ